MSSIRSFVPRNIPFLVAAAALTAGAGCDNTRRGPESSAAPSDAPSERVSTAAQALVGTDGALTVSATNTVVNQYAVLAANVAAGANSVSVTNIADLTSATLGPLAAGDLIMIVQMQGATIDTSNTAQYGTVTALGSAGRYEIVGVTGTQGNTISLDTSCGGLKFAYTTAGKTQIVRVPQLTTLTVTNAGSIVAPAWDGARGGVVAVHAQSTVTLNGPIDVSARGFRGGVVDNNTQNAGSNVVLYRSANDTDGAEKGEGIAGFQAAYTNGRYGRGAPANGGGGGNSHNAGGGGGSNARNLLNAMWTGQGVMTAVTGSAAWLLDPGYIANGNMLTTSAGGGRGGYTYSANNSDALTVAPGNAAWGGDNRREVGGLGGRPLDPDPAGRVFFGGGGGAGDGNNGAAGAGGIGGGLAIVIASAVNGSSSIRANGGAGANTAAGSGGNDAPGGGGGGGTVLVSAATVAATITVEARGGVGGNQIIAGNEAEGPGGGGGGGYVLVPAPAVTNVSGGLGGTSNSGAVTEFPTNGATSGNAGAAVATPTALSACIDTTAPDTTIATAEPNPTNDPTGDFTFTSNDPTATFECSLDGAAFTACPATFSTAALAQGSHTLQVRAKDPMGNVDPTPASHTWVIDTTPPDTTIPTAEPNPTGDATGDFVFASNDPAATFECSVDGAAFTACPQTFSTAALPDGSHTIQVRARDAAGNVDPTPASHTWVVDTTAPDTTIPTAEPNPTSDPTGDFVFGSNDPAATYECSVDGGAFVACPQTFSTAALADGSHTLAVRARDAVGNVDPTPATHTWVVDATPPDTTIPTTEPNPTSDNTGDFVFGSNDAAATFECRVDGGAFVTCAQTFSTGALADGSHTIEVRARDAVGNVDPTPATYTWVVDTTAPDTTIPTAEPNPTSDPTGDFAFGSNDPAATYECSVDGAAFTACPQTFSTAALAEGSHTIAVRARDALGNVDPTPASYTWVVDTTPPETAIATAEPDPTSDPTGDFAFTSPDPTATFECSIDGGAFVPCAPSMSTAPLADGSHTIAVRAVDPAGNVDPTPATHTWVVDTDADDDGLSDADEATLGTDPNDADSDDDGVLDGQEINPGEDTDGDGLINALDPDSDDDGLFDGTEMGLGCGHPATSAAAHHCVADADNGATKTDPLDPDTDDGGVKDGAEDGNLNGKIDPGETDPTAGHGADDTTVVDTDGDGLSDGEEATLGTDPNDADSDDDGVLDGQEPNPADDTDGDGLINALDPDSDNDGLFDGTEMGLGCGNAATDPTKHHCVADADSGATKTSPLDPDTDDGGVRDGAEDLNLDGKIDPGETDPTAGHGADDASVVDTDGDGLSDGEEATLGTDPGDADSDDDGVLDGQEPNPADDTDGDGKINALDPDSDDDGLFDGTEMGLGCGNAATDLSKMACVADADPASKTSALIADTDHGSVKDGDEDTNKNGKVDPGERDPLIASDDVSTGTDTDGDGLSDAEEEAIGTDPNDADSDDDGVRDGAEPSPGVDSDGDGLINALDPDSDNDGLFDGTELGLGCGDAATDLTKHHCVADADSGATKTDPLDPDTDDGGASDGAEDANLNGRIDTGETDPTAGHGADDATVVDTDGDGLSDPQEATLGTDPNDADSDDDGLIDGQEANPADDTDADGKINALDPDSDGDGLFDGTEMGQGCGNAATDLTKNQCLADADPGTKTSPVDPDTDHGGVKDGDEDVNKDGKVDPGERDPLVAADDLTGLDSDGDGLTDAEEVALGTDPKDADSDDDGVKDGAEPKPGDDTDGDGKINALDPDSDDDGIFDGTELGLGCDDAATDVSKMQCIADADGGATRTDPLDPDTDHGGVKDGIEDANKNGRIDLGETDPNDAADDVAGACNRDADCGGAKSGRVCDLDKGVCVDGCHATGNGCPSGLACTSSSSELGICDRVVGAGNGLICAARPQRDDARDAWLPLALLACVAGAAARRRRK